MIISALKAFAQGQTHLDEIISSAKMISPKQDWERIDELLEESAEFAKTDLASQASILENLLDRGLTIGEMIRFFSRENAKKDIRTDCHYYSGNPDLKCTVNPSGDCRDCWEFQSE